MNVCLFGGAFNPPHRTHERVIRAALAQLPIEEVVVLPCGSHPHKEDGGLAPAPARVELCHLAFDGIPGVRVDDWETRQTGLSYTVETVRYFREYVTAGERPYWIIGADNLTILPSWHRHHELLELAILVTCPRMGYPVDDKMLAEFDLNEAERAEILGHVLQVEADDVSASDLRQRLREHGDTSALLHPAVEQRIRELGLYQAEDDPA